MVKNQGHLEPQEALSFHTMCCTINIIYNFSTQRKFLVPDNPFGKDVKIEMILTSVKKGLYFLHTNSYIAFDLFFLLSFSDNVHFYVFWCLLARSKTQYQSFCDWVVWGQNRTKRCKSYFVFLFQKSPGIWPRFCFQEVNVSPESLKYIWYPELEIYGLERFGRQRVLKEMSGVRIRRNRTIHYELG